LDSLKRDVIYLPKNSLCRCFNWCKALTLLGSN
jgi:hypothetical protein